MTCRDCGASEQSGVRRTGVHTGVWFGGKASPPAGTERAGAAAVSPSPAAFSASASVRPSRERYSAAARRTSPPCSESIAICAGVLTGSAACRITLPSSSSHSLPAQRTSSSSCGRPSSTVGASAPRARSRMGCSRVRCPMAHVPLVAFGPARTTSPALEKRHRFSGCPCVWVKVTLTAPLPSGCSGKRQCCPGGSRQPEASTSARSMTRFSAGSSSAFCHRRVVPAPATAGLPIFPPASAVSSLSRSHPPRPSTTTTAAAPSRRGARALLPAFFVAAAISLAELRTGVSALPLITLSTSRFISAAVA